MSGHGRVGNKQSKKKMEIGKGRKRLDGDFLDVGRASWWRLLGARIMVGPHALLPHGVAKQKDCNGGKRTSNFIHNITCLITRGLGLFIDFLIPFKRA